MRTYTVIAVALVVAVVGVQSYTTKYDNINLDDILSNDRLLKKYHECLVAETDSSCTADGKELRAAIPDALTNDCASCNEKQKNGAYKVVGFLIKNKPDLWKALESKYDPSGSYQKKYDAELKKVTA